tara:strand:- start:116 stop:646 length:531 start_codon:yes stop_codon:yes gene_type:complete
MSIEFFTDILTEEENSEALEYAYKSKSWEFQSSVSRRNNPKIETIDFYYLSVPKNNDFFYKHIFLKIQKLISKEVSIEKVYFNSQSTGSHGTFHIDVCDITALIYLSPYNIEWGGFTQFLPNIHQYELNGYPEIKCIAPFPRSMVIFDSNILHKGYSFAYQHCPIRYSLAYKLNYV